MKYSELSKEEVKKIFSQILMAYSIKNVNLNFLIKDFKWFITKKEKKIYIVRKEVAKILSNKEINIEKFGLYLCKLEKDGIRLSIEGCQIFGPFANDRIVDFDLHRFHLGEVPEIKENGYVIIRDNSYFSGTCKRSGKGIINYISKNRRILR